MLVTVELLRKYEAYEDDIKYIECFYPNGAEMIDIIQDKHIPKEMLHWGRQYLSYTKEEFEAYCAACNISFTEGHWYSQDVRDSKYVINSKDVTNSIGVFGSSDIHKSFDVDDSDEVTDSKQIFCSSMIEECEKVYRSQNITRSVNICNSTMVVDSKNVIDSNSIFNSSEIIKCINVSSSYFCQNCKNIKHCMFCEDLEDAEYYIFNKPVDQNYFDLFEKQYLKYLTERLDFIREWPEDLVVSASVAPTRKFDDWYHSITPKFWKWARTLPNFDSMILYNITMLPELLT